MIFDGIGNEFMNVAYLLIGGNMGNRPVNLQTAKNEIAAHCGNITAQSAVYETAAWGLEDQPSFLNQALELKTFLKPHALLQCLLAIETSMGRRREVKYGPRLIDIDIILYNDDIISTPELTIPHPALPNRRFALQCLADIAPHKMHPVFKMSIQKLLAQCPDPLNVNKFY